MNEANQQQAKPAATIIKPGVGRVLWYWPSQDDLAARAATSRDPIPQGPVMTTKDASQPMEARVLLVHSDRSVALGVFDHAGQYHYRSSVYLCQPGDDMPAGGFAAWMPYQVGQAAKGDNEVSELRRRADSLAQQVDKLLADRDSMVREIGAAAHDRTRLGDRLVRLERGASAVFTPIAGCAGGQAVREDAVAADAREKREAEAIKPKISMRSRRVRMANPPSSKDHYRDVIQVEAHLAGQVIGSLLVDLPEARELPKSFEHTLGSLSSRQPPACLFNLTAKEVGELDKFIAQEVARNLTLHGQLCGHSGGRPIFAIQAKLQGREIAATTVLP